MRLRPDWIARLGLRSPLPVAAVIGLLAGCQPVVFKTSVKGETTIPGNPSPLSNVLTAFPPVGSYNNIDFNQNQDFKNQGISKQQVDSVRVDSISLTIEDPSSQDFGFLDTLQISAKTGDTEIQFAHKDNISQLGLAAPNPTLNLDVDKTAELKPYVTAPSMSIIVRGQGRVPPQDTRLGINVVLRVGVKVF